MQLHANAEKRLVSFWNFASQGFYQKVSRSAKPVNDGTPVHPAAYNM